MKRNTNDFNDGVVYGIQNCNAEFQVLITKTFNKFYTSKKNKNMDFLEKILTELSKISLGDEIHPHLRSATQTSQKNELVIPDVRQMLAFIKDVAEWDGNYSSTRLKLTAMEILKANFA